MNDTLPRARKGRSRACDLAFSSPSHLSHSEYLDDGGVDHAQHLAPAEDVKTGDTGHQGTVQLGFRDSYPAKRGYHPFADGPTDPLPIGVVAEISLLHRKQGSPLPWDLPPIDRAGLDSCQFRQLSSQACTLINQYARSTRYEDLYPDAHDLADRLYRYASRRWGIHAFSHKQCIRPAEAALDYTYITGNEPSEAGFCEWQTDNGKASGQARRDRCSERDRFIIDADATGVDGTDIARECAVRWPHLGHSPSTVSRVLARARLARTIKSRDDDINSPVRSGIKYSSVGLREGSCKLDDEPMGQVAEAPPQHWILASWYAKVGAYLSEERAERLVEFADRIEAEELAGNELPNGQGLQWLVGDVIVGRCSTKDHPAAYLMACIDNHGQDVPAELVRETVQAVGFDFDRKVQYVVAARNPVAYLTSLRNGRGENGGLCDASPMGVGLVTLKRWAPELVTPDFEAEAQRLLDWERRPGRYVEDYRRRFGRLPWEDQPDSNTSDPEASPRGIPSDAEVEPWPQADPPVKPGKLEHPENPPFSPVPRETRRDTSHGEALKPVERYPSASQNAGAVARLEQAPCRHPLAKMLALVMQLDAIEQVDCAATGCSCTLYSDRGQIQCPCHYPAAKATAAGRALQAQFAGMVR